MRSELSVNLENVTLFAVVWRLWRLMLNVQADRTSECMAIIFLPD